MVRYSNFVTAAAILSLFIATKSFAPSRTSSSRVESKMNLYMTSSSSSSSSSSTIFKEHASYLQNVAVTEPPPKLELLLQLLDMLNEEDIVSPNSREGMNPFLIPISRSRKDGSMLCYIRWPTQKDNMDLQLVRTTDVGVYLVAMGTDQYCHRLVVEQDFFCTETASKAVELLNTAGQVNCYLINNEY
jgi:hypothetical protein